MIDRSCVRVFLVSRTLKCHRSGTQLAVPVVPSERVRIVAGIAMGRVAALWRKQNETGIPCLQNSFVSQPNQASENDRVGARFGGMKKDQHRKRLWFTRALGLIETGIARVAVSVGPRTQPRTSGARRVARSHKAGEPPSVHLCWGIAERTASGAGKYVEARRQHQHQRDEQRL